MASKSQQSRELTKQNNDMLRVKQKMDLNQDVSEYELKLFAVGLTFGWVQFSITKDNYESFKKSLQAYIKKHPELNQRIEAFHTQFCWELQVRSRGRQYDTDFILSKLSNDDLRTVLMNTKNIAWDSKILRQFIDVEELNAHSTEQTAEYFVPRYRKRSDIDWDSEDKKDHPTQLTMKNPYVKKMIEDSSTKLLMEGE